MVIRWEKDAFVVVNGLITAPVMRYGMGETVCELWDGMEITGHRQWDEKLSRREQAAGW